MPQNNIRKGKNMPTAKTIKMLLYDGSLSGVMNISDSAWEIGKMYSAPRESISDLASKADCKKYGVYLLLSEQQVYVGQASDLERRTRQHLNDKDWWTQVVLMTTKDDSFNASDIDYLEACLIELADKAGKSDSDNKKRGNPRRVDEFREAELDHYLEEALFLLELIGIRVFKSNAKKTTRKPPIRPVIVDEPLSDGNQKQGTTTKPPLPETTMGPCAFAKTALQNLLASGYVFTDEQIKVFSSVAGSKPYTTRNLPMFWLLKEGESRSTCEKNIRSRYWKDEFVSGKYRFLMYSQWYEDSQKGATKNHFIEWYKTL